MAPEEWIIRRCRELYDRYNRPEYIDPDPLSVVRGYDSREEREIAALLGSSLALGRVELILKSIDDLLSRLPRPLTSLAQLSEEELRERSAGYRYRFFTGEHLCNLLIALSRLLRREGSIESSLRRLGDGSLQQGLAAMVDELLLLAPGPTSILLSRPAAGSASKRLHLFLRWMVRRDAVDPGGWDAFSPSELLVPVDTHMLQVARALGITRRKQADRRTSEEITRFFRRWEPADPVRYDFVLTRFGIRPGFFDEVVAEFGENPYTP